MKPLLAFNIQDISLGSGKGTLGGTYSSTSTLISIVLKYSLTAASIILLGFLIFWGFTFIMNAGSGDAKKAEQSKSAIFNTLVGFGIVLFAYVIIQIIQVITGLNILNPTNLNL
jgi:hypothetical protein